MLKRYVHALAAKLERETTVVYEQHRETRSELAALGFRRAARIPGLKPSGDLYVQDPE